MLVVFFTEYLFKGLDEFFEHICRQVIDAGSGGPTPAGGEAAAESVGSGFVREWGPDADLQCGIVVFDDYGMGSLRLLSGLEVGKNPGYSS